MSNGSGWICTNPNCKRYMKETDIDYYEDHEGYSVLYCKWCGDAV